MYMYMYVFASLHNYIHVPILKPYMCVDLPLSFPDLKLHVIYIHVYISNVLLVMRQYSTGIKMLCNPTSYYGIYIYIYMYTCV